MLDARPAWNATPRNGLTQWYGHVWLLRDVVLGQWFAARRSDGVLLWETRHGRPNTVCDVSEDLGIILASETRSDGPWTADFGCYGLSLHTGELLWTNHGSGSRTGILRALDFVPGFTNELRDSPSCIRDGTCVCNSGRILDLVSGEQTGQLSKDEVSALRQPTQRRPGAALYHTGAASLDDYGLTISNGTRRPDGAVRLTRGMLRLTAHETSGRDRWVFDMANTPYYIDGNFYSYRLVPPNVYLIVSENPRFEPGAKSELAPPSVYHVLVLDVSRGEVVQDLSLADKPLRKARIEDTDDAGLLVSSDETTLHYWPVSG